MRHSKRAIDAIAVAQLDLIPRRSYIFIVAPLAEPSLTEAVEEGDGAAVITLPVDVFDSMLITLLLPGSIGLNLAILAQ